MSTVAPPLVELGVVLDDVASDGAVGDDDLGAVGAHEHGREQPDVGYLAGQSADRDPVPDAEGTKQQDHHPGGEVGEAALQREAHRETRRREDGEDRGGLDAHRLGGRRHGRDEHDIAGDTAEEAGQCDVDLGPLERLAG
ncbi:MAG: hypothetical protein AAF602_32825, partial [Myxococcota bacterium]